MKCLNCSTDNEGNAKFCSGCGTSLEESKENDAAEESAGLSVSQEQRALLEDENFCKSCGEIIKKAAEICPKCGVRLMDPPIREEISGKPSLFWKVIWIVGSLFIPLVGLIVGIKYLVTKNRKKYGLLLLCLGGISIFMWMGIAGSSSGTGTTESSGPPMTLSQVMIQAVDIEYDPLYRNIETHVGKIVHLKGKVVQVQIRGGDRYNLRLAMDGDYDQMVYITYSGDRVLDEDTVEVWGRVKGLYSYKTILGATVTLPEIHELFAEVNP